MEQTFNHKKNYCNNNTDNMIGEKIVLLIFECLLFCLLKFIFKVDYFYSIIVSITILWLSLSIAAVNCKRINKLYHDIKEKLFRFIAFLPVEILSFIFALSILIFGNQIVIFFNVEINKIVELLKILLNFVNTDENKGFEIIQNILHFVLSYIFVFIFFVGIIFWKAILNSIKEFWNKDVILKIVSREFINDVLNAESKISYNLGVKGIIQGLAGKGISLKTEHFVKLLGISASIEPNEVYGCWNTTDGWYPLKDVYDIKIDRKTKNVSLFISEKWKSYFDNLDKVYKNKKGNHKRIFVVEDPKQILENLKDKNQIEDYLYWVELLKKHNEWGVKEIIFISKKELEEQINDGINSEIPNWKDFAIFRKKYFCIWFIKVCFKEKIWAFAQEEEPNNNSSTVIFSTGKKLENILNFFIDIENKRWQESIHFKLSDNKLKHIITK